MKSLPEKKRNAEPLPSLKEMKQLFSAAYSDVSPPVITFSGGVDSGLLAVLGQELFGNDCLIVTAISPSFSERSRLWVEEAVNLYGLNHSWVETDEWTKAGYQRNAGDRCFYCKESLFDALVQNFKVSGQNIWYGAHLGDLKSHRPGFKAVTQAGVVCPYLTLKWDKAMIRKCAKEMGLSFWDRPSQPCLASRVPHYSEVTQKKLAQIEAAELILWELGCTRFRVRHHGELARLELAESEHERVWRARKHITQAMKKIGFLFVTIDLQDFSSGSLSLLLERREHAE